GGQNASGRAIFRLWTTVEMWVARRSVEVDRVPELHTEPDSVLIRIDLYRRRPRSPLLEKRVPPKDACKCRNLIRHLEIQCERLHVDLLCLSGAYGLRGVVRGVEKG